MSSSFVFNATEFESLLLKYGIKKTWKNLLATHISHSGPEFQYILSDPIFKGAKVLPLNLLADYSIGEIGVLYEYSVAFINSSSRKVNGQFFTPDDVALLMVRQSKDFPDGKWLDPCAGIGNLSWHLVNSKDDKESFLINQMILSDKDELALLIARVLFTISFQSSHANLYNDIESSFVKFDFLSTSENLDQLNFGENGLSAIPPHDFVIVNPPYLSVKGEDRRFETAKSRDLYAYFLENIIKTSKGFISITPQSFTNSSKFSSLRRLLLQNYESLRIYAFDNIPGNIFIGVKFGSTNSNTANSIRACIMVAGSFLKPGGYRITSLMRWRTNERSVFFENIDSFLSSPILSEKFFPKVNAVFIELYNEIRNLRPMSSILCSKETRFALYVPSSPRYFISALLKPVERASLKTLYFKTSSDRDLAFLLLNSSYMYWWWRVRDGGMTLSLETIGSLPLLDFKVDNALKKRLIKSESLNKVFKMNAGALQENVKHDQALISALNDLVAPKWSKLLLKTHENSELVQIPARHSKKV
jgi:N-6 DNA Methylase